MKMLATLALTLTAACASPATGPATPGPSLSFLGFTPVSLRGEGFAGRERVAVTLSVDGSQRTMDVRASTAGTFTVDFSGFVIPDRCNSDVWALAAPLHGDRIYAKLPQLLCPPLL